MTNSRFFEAVEAKWRMVHDISRDPAAMFGEMSLQPATQVALTKAFIEFLPQGEPFFWESRICDVVQYAAPQLDRFEVDPTVYPVPCGFCWFEHPLPLDPPSGMYAAFAGAPPDIVITMCNGFFWALYEDREGLAAMHCAFTSNARDGRPAVGEFELVRPGIDLIDTADRHNLATSVGEWLPEEERPRYREFLAHRGLALRKYIAAAILFANQKLIHMRTEHLPRGAARRLAKLGAQDDEIRVITLRERRSVPEEGHIPEPGNWHYQWLVRGFWRNQACGPEMKDHRPTWVAPYLKGPEGLPFKPPKSRLFAVTR